MNEVSLFYTRGQIFDSDKQKVCNLCEPYDKNSNIIVSSVNNTYAKGINPEAVEDMHNLLLSIRRQDFEQIIDLALQNEDGHDLDYSDLLILSVYVETQTIDIWWSDFFFERYVGAQDWALDNSFGAGQTITVTAGEHLKENWKDEVKGFIMDNLHRAHIDNEEIEKL